MVSTFFGLNTAASALAAQQAALNTTGHNIANANTEGYSRQEATTVAAMPYTMPSMNKAVGPGQLGSGVKIDQIRQIRDSFLDTQFRKESTTSGYYEAKQYSMDKVETVFNEPSTSGLNTALSTFWQGIQDLANNPAESVNREVVAQQGAALAETINHLGTQMQDMRDEFNDEIVVKTSEVNDIAKQIASLNVQIKSVESDPTNHANDWRDQRNLLVDKLSKLLKITVQERPEGDIEVSVGGHTLVDGADCDKIVAQKRYTGDYPYYNDVNWEDGSAVNLGSAREESGYLKGLMDNREPASSEDFLNQLDALAKNIYTGMNLIQQTGYGENKAAKPTSPYDQFFVVDESKTSSPHFSMKISMNDNLVQHLGEIAAAATPDAGTTSSNLNDGNNALQMAKLIQNGFISNGDSNQGEMKLYKNNALVGTVKAYYDETTKGIKVEATIGGTAVSGALTDFDGSSGKLLFNDGGTPATDYEVKIEGGTSFAGYYEKMMSNLGVKSQQTTKMVDNQSLLVDNIDNMRKSVMGVSLDEEMTNMIRFQQAYSAAARVVTAMDEMLDTIINRLGLVGR